MPRRIPKVAKRANRENPRIDRNPPFNFSGQELHKIKRVDLLPRNLAQEHYIDALQDDRNDIVFAVGPAGSGKTLLCTQFAIQQLQQRRIERIVITRPAVSNGEELGALPGTLIEKMAPWTRPLFDIFRDYYSLRTITNMLEEEIIEICPLGFMRGRTLKAAHVIFDEAQNSSSNQMQMCLTRIGEGSRMFITGDLMQHDRGYDDNGLLDFITRLERHHCPGIAVCRFDVGDVERHPIIENILQLYNDHHCDKPMRKSWNGNGATPPLEAHAD